MASTQDIRRRIKSVKNIQQITKAMKMVAAARLRRAQESALANKPYAEKMQAVLRDVAGSAGDINHPLLEVRPVNKKAYVVLAADKGLAGAYSSNVFKEVITHFSNKSDADLITVGRKARDYFFHRGYNIVTEYAGFSERPTYEHAKHVAMKIMELFTSGEYDEIHMVYTKFISPINVVPTTVKLLPISDIEGEEKQSGGEYIYEPNAGEVLGLLLPQYLETMVYGALLQSAASELGSRMTAMSAATDNADELISKLVLNYNKVRQAGITREINEIVSGAEALK
ncbi:ATP synthase F1 subunit gamma [Anaerosinus gibii]|uniref:ATP synthase gamma chain n=1 Tax=Selenobaculum gibii TaxID=3054208 RepID=A0A9Y2AJH5_9FIRM|nr:ATP synthase F1 subunit gamma [Selenobaculum gbiensis]WIW70971.1 ATP synthase F1 subunit gamma [Selenobaculum gbiensis]